MSGTAAIPPTASKLRRYRLGMADGAHGPGDVGPLVVTDGGSIAGPDLTNWQVESMLAICEEPLTWRGDFVAFLVLSPRYLGVNLESVRREGGIVGVGRILPGYDPREWPVLQPRAMDYWGVGVISLLEG